MARTAPQEPEGFAPTDEELATVTAPVDDGDDVPLDDDPVPEPAVAAKTDAPEPPPAADKPADEIKTVDVRALQEARAEAREAKQRATVLEQRWNDYLAGQQASQRPAAQAETLPAIPDPKTDPLGALEWATEQVRQANERRDTETRQATEQYQAREAYSRDYAKVDAAITAAAQVDPTVSEAFTAVLQSALNEYAAMGFPQQQAQAEVQRLAEQHVSYMARSNVDVGTYLKGLATARGWRPAAPAAPQTGKVDVAAIASAQQRHQSLSDAPGGEAIAPLDAKALAKMSDKDFKAWMSKKGNEARFDEMMGR